MINMALSPEFTALFQTENYIEPETLTRFIDEDNSEMRELLMVIKAITISDVVFNDMDVFENAVQVLNGITPDIDKMEGVSPKHLWYALSVMRKIKPELELSHEVRMYIKYICTQDGLNVYPYEPIPEEILTLIKNKSAQLTETRDGIQAYKLLKIQEYVNANNRV